MNIYLTTVYIYTTGWVTIFLFRPANVEKCFLTFTYVISLYQSSAFAALMQLYVIPIFSTSICYTVVKWSPLLLLPIAGNEIICLTIFSYRLLFCLQLGLAALLTMKRRPYSLVSTHYQF